LFRFGFFFADDGDFVSAPAFLFKQFLHSGGCSVTICKKDIRQSYQVLPHMLLKNDTRVTTNAHHKTALVTSDSSSWRVFDVVMIHLLKFLLDTLNDQRTKLNYLLKD